MSKASLLIWLSFISINVFGIDIRVGLNNIGLSTSVTFIAAGSGYSVYEGQKKILFLRKDESVRVEAKGSRMQLKKFTKPRGLFKELKFVAENDSGFFRIRSNHPETPTIPYDGGLELRFVSSKIGLINILNIEKYVAAVVESEVGNVSYTEFLKVQSILARTFVMSHRERHAQEGFSVCDQTHCQAYNSRNRFNDSIPEQVRATANLVIADTLNNLIAAPYHSNCGGQTIAAQDVWSGALHNTQSVVDSFCLLSAHSTWQKSIPRNEWVKYLSLNGAALPDSANIDSSVSFQQEKRMVCFKPEGIGLPLKKIRDDFNLNSTFFSVCLKEDSILFVGRGFGHGVGLCQEGAIEMAQLGFHCEEILHFYFRDTRVTDFNLCQNPKR